MSLLYGLRINFCVERVIKILKNKTIELDSSFAKVLQAMSNIQHNELEVILSKCSRKKIKPGEIFLKIGESVEEIYFVESGLTRHFTHDKSGNEYTTHFAYKNEFEADYTAFVTLSKAGYCLQALEQTSLVVIPREAYDWLAANVKGGEKLIRLVTENFFVYFSNRLREHYTLTPLERYQAMGEKFPNIYAQVPQYMIASYIGVSKVHLSRIKSEFKKLQNNGAV